MSFSILIAWGNLATNEGLNFYNPFTRSDLVPEYSLFSMVTSSSSGWDPLSPRTTILYLTCNQLGGKMVYVSSVKVYDLPAMTTGL